VTRCFSEAWVCAVGAVIALSVYPACERRAASGAPNERQTPNASLGGERLGADSAAAPAPDAVAAMPPDAASNGAAQTAEAAPEAAPLPADPLRVASRWMSALGVKDTASLEQTARYPFQLRDNGSDASCKGGRAENAAQLAAVLDCILNQSIMQRDLKDIPEPVMEILDAKPMPVWSKRWQKGLPPGLVPVKVELPANGIYYELVLLIGNGGVFQMWKVAEFDSN
jgi:hypothetical protein